ncbi:hypothetical protein BDZ97DRAFT_1959013 [Flammula alnicola]|nr:hypothetical protein BDZ97DRAFT_1959013 [Flammula alnicola]
MSHLIDLPEELRIQILSNLDYRSLLRCASVCTSLYHTLKQSSSLQYTIELALNGMQDAGTDIPYAELLSRLRSRRTAWTQLDCKDLTVIPIGNECQAYELVGGAFAKSSGQDLKVMWLPTATNEGHTLYRLSVGIPIRDFAIDPTLDVVAILEDDNLPMSFTQARHVRIHIRSISTNHTHPLARQSPLCFDVPAHSEYGNALFTAVIQLAEDLVSLYTSKGHTVFMPRVLIWNWKKGVLIYDSDITGLPSGTYDFTLLNRSSFLLTSTKNHGSLQLFSLLDSPASSPELVTTLSLPTLNPTYRIHSFGIHSGPIHSNPPPNAPFTSVDAERLHVVNITYWTATPMHGDQGLFAFSMYVHNRVFLAYLEGRGRTCTVRYDSIGETDDSRDNPDDSVVEWDAWGPQNTLFMPSRSPPHWLRYVHGQRVICSTGTPVIDVLDFGYSPTKSTVQLCVSTTSFPVFVADVVTRLPCHTSQRELDDEFYAYMIDEDRIIGLVVSFLFCFGVLSLCVNVADMI